jgi:Tfp pilus assembly protein PilN
MIKINLATRKQSGASVVQEPKSMSLDAAALRNKLDDFRDLPLKKIALMFVVGVMATYLLDGYQKEELQKASDEITRVTSEQTKLQTELDKTKGYEAVKTGLDEDEKILRTKIDTIQQLLKDRQTPPKLLGSLASSMPKDLWLTSFKLENELATFQGSSTDFNQISDFMKTLSENAFFTDVKLKLTQQAMDQTSNTVVVNFELTAGRRR